MEAFHHNADVIFHNVEYSLSINADDNHILIEAEQKDDGSRWSSDFSCRCAFRVCVLSVDVAATRACGFSFFFERHCCPREISIVCIPSVVNFSHFFHSLLGLQTSKR